MELGELPDAVSSFEMAMELHRATLDPTNQAQLHTYTHSHSHTHTLTHSHTHTITHSHTHSLTHTFNALTPTRRSILNPEL